MSGGITRLNIAIFFARRATSGSRWVIRQRLVTRNQRDQIKLTPEEGDREYKDRPADSPAQISPTDFVIKNKDVQKLVVGFPGDDYTSLSRKTQGC